MANRPALPGAHGFLVAPDRRTDPSFYRWFKALEELVAGGTITANDANALIAALTLRVDDIEAGGTGADLLAAMYGTNGINVFGSIPSGVEIRGPAQKRAGNPIPGPGGEDGADSFVPGPRGRDGIGRDGAPGPAIFMAAESEQGDSGPPGPRGATGATGSAGAPGGSFTLLGTATVAGAAATTLTLSSLDLSAYKAFVLEYALDNATGSSANISLYYNADTTATNYNQQGLTANNATVTGARSNNAIFDTMIANETTTGTITISKDRDSRPRARIMNNRSASASVEFRIGAHSWTSATNVTGITFSSSVASSLAIGSTFSVYGVS